MVVTNISKKSGFKIEIIGAIIDFCLPFVKTKTRLFPIMTQNLKASTKVFLIIMAFAIGSCTRNRTVTPAFYHWKTELSINSAQNSNLKKIGVEKLYVKFFDVDWSDIEKEPIPLATLFVNDSVPDFEIIPCVFITNRTFYKITDDDNQVLAKRTGEKIKTLLKKYEFKDVKEIQFDCDWSERTQATFFDFLEYFKKEFPEFELSSTIRLHQVKFFEKTGVPPVSKGMLMFYNMSDVSDWETENSILDLPESKKYLKNFDKYPLKLDVVLPAYSWGVLFRDGEMIKLLPDIDEGDLGRFKNMGNRRYWVKKSTYFAQQYLYENDWIRYESINPDSLLKAAHLLSDLIENPNLTVGFYHLGSHSFENYPKKTYKDVLEVFKSESAF